MFIILQNPKEPIDIQFADERIYAVQGCNLWKAYILDEDYWHNIT